MSQQSPHHVWIGEDDGQVALLIDGVVQSVRVEDGPLGPGYWPLMIPNTRPERALILGLGGGTVAHLLWKRFGDVAITGVENDRAVIELARDEFGLAGANVKIVEGDAFGFVGQTQGPFDYIAVDLFADGRIPAGVFARPFLRRVKDLLTPGGQAAINFFKDKRVPTRLHRLRTVFPRVSVRESRENVVAHCRPR